jgi:hypothetical protein
MRHAFEKYSLVRPRHKVASLYGIGVREKLPKLFTIERLPTRWNPLMRKESFRFKELKHALRATLAV